MGLIFIDGFDHYVTDEIPRKWDEYFYAEINVDSPRRAGGHHLRLASAVVEGYVDKMLPSLKNTVTVGFALKITSLDNNFGIMRLIRNGVITLTVKIEMDGSISVRRGDHDGTVLGQSSISVVPLNSWLYFEAKIFVNDSSGTYQIRINETTVLTGSGADTQFASDSGVDRVRISAAGVMTTPVAYICIDDLYMDDANFQGDCRVDLLYPQDYGTYNQWDPVPTYHNWNNVRDVGDMDDDSTICLTNVLNEIDMYNFENLLAISGSEVKGVALNLAMRKDDAGKRKVTPMCIIDSVEYMGTEGDIWDTYRVMQQIWENSPANPSLAWTDDEVNGAEFGVKLTT